MTTVHPTRTQIRDAIVWLAWWHTGGAHPDAADRSAHVEHILGQRAYDVIATTAEDWYRRRGGCAVNAEDETRELPGGAR